MAQAKLQQAQICRPLQEKIVYKLGSSNFDENESFLVLYNLSYCMYELGLTYMEMNAQEQGLTILNQSIQYANLCKTNPLISQLLPSLESKILYTVYIYMIIIFNRLLRIVFQIQRNSV